MGTRRRCRPRSRRGSANTPATYPLYDIVLTDLEPRWGGSLWAIYDFANLYAGAKTAPPTLRLLYFALYRDLLELASLSCGNQAAEQRAICVAAVMDKIVISPLPKNLDAAFQLYGTTDKAEFSAVFGTMMAAMINSDGGDAYSGAILQRAASAMGSATQLKEENPGHNNPFVDDAVAASWYRKGFYDNAWAKDHEALGISATSPLRMRQASTRKLRTSTHAWR
jgi:hypothetical protein